jgi:hypothetical protein
MEYFNLVGFTLRHGHVHPLRRKEKDGQGEGKGFKHEHETTRCLLLAEGCTSPGETTHDNVERK